MIPGRRSALAVLVRCHWLVCAIPARAVTRLVLPEEVVVSGNGPPWVVSAGEDRWAGWDLGQLLDLGDESAAWLLVQVPDEERPLKLALRTGTCLRVQELVVAFELPEQLFRARRSAFAGAFPVTDLGGDLGIDHGVLGVLLDPERLLHPGEIVASREILATTTDPASISGA